MHVWHKTQIGIWQILVTFVISHKSLRSGIFRIQESVAEGGGKRCGKIIKRRFDIAIVKDVNVYIKLGSLV